MSDRLVKLYDLQDCQPHLERLKTEDINIRRAMAYEKFQVVEWVRTTFGLTWAGECDVAFSNHPVTCFIAVSWGSIIGFACYDSTYKNFFGPIGVAVNFQKRGVGTALVLRSLHAMAENGFAYAILGASDAAAGFYARLMATIEIPASSPGIYCDRLK
jgi:ribosomal protein S18 acetylase RimI-like enzyme